MLRLNLNHHLLALVAIGGVVFLLLLRSNPTLLDRWLLLIALGWLLLRPKNWLPWWPSLSLGLWLICGFLSIALNPPVNPLLANFFLSQDIGLAMGCSLLASVVRTLNHPGFIAGLVGLVVAALASLLACFFVQMGWAQLPGVLFYNLRWAGFQLDPNAFGSFMLVAAVGSGYLGFLSKGVAGLGWYLLTPGFVLGLIMSYSRGAWIAALVVGLLLLVWGRLGLRQWLVFALTGLIGLGALVYPLLDNPRLLSYLESRLGLQHYDATRFLVHRVALKESLQEPMGVGTAQSIYVLGDTIDSFYIRLLYENGWLGFLALVSFIVATLLHLIGHLRSGFKVYALLLALNVGLLVSLTVTDGIHWRFLWVVWALSWGTYGPARNPPIPKHYSATINPASSR